MYFRIISFFALICILISCGNSLESKFPMEKRFWGPEDYDDVIRSIRYTTPEGQRFPELNSIDTAPIFKKLTDHENFLVILTDDQLGISHRSEVANDFFQEYREMVDTYYLTDRQDKFVYGMELVEILKFGLNLQLYYFKLGNDKIIKEADDPDHRDIKSVIQSNEKVIFENYNYFLDFVNKESSFSAEELKVFSDCIDTYFPKLFETFPNTRLNIIKNKAELMLKKAENKDVKESLERLLKNISKLNSV